MTWDARFHDRYREFCREHHLDPEHPESARQYLSTKKGQRVGSINNNVLALKNLGIDITPAAVQEVIRECYETAPDRDARPRAIQRARATSSQTPDTQPPAPPVIRNSYKPILKTYTDYCHKQQLRPTLPRSAAQFLLTKKGISVLTLTVYIQALRQFGIDIRDATFQDAIRECRAAAPDSTTQAQPTPPASSATPDTKQTRRRRDDNSRQTATQSVLRQAITQMTPLAQQMTTLQRTLTQIAERQARHDLDDQHYLYARQEGTCAGCHLPINYPNMSLDHIIPRSQGGTHDITNLQLLCFSCNAIKGDRPMSYLHAVLKGRKPE